MSVVRAIYASLAAQNVTFDTEAGSSVTPQVLDLHQLRNQIQAASCPIRLILPYSAVTEARDGHWLTPPAAAGTARSQQTWFIADLLLWKPGQLGRGIGEVAADLVRYQGAYSEMLRGMVRMKLSTNAVKLMGWTMKPGLYDWPMESGDYFQGVLVVLEVTEVLDT